MDSRVLITGATGFIGQHLINQLLVNGARVRILTRGTHSLPASWINQVEVIEGDLSNPSTLSRAVADTSVVYHLAGEIRDPTRMHTVNVEGTRNLLAACEKTSVRHIVYLSTVGVMGATRDGIVDESQDCHPLNDYERTKYEAEQNVLEWSQKTGVAVTALRPTIVFGSGSRIIPDSMLAWLRAIQSGRFVFFDRRAIANYVYAGDVISACLHVVQLALQGVFIVADPCPLTEFVAACAAALQVSTPRLFFPLPFAYAGVSLLHTFVPNSPLTVSRVRALSSKTIYRSMRMNEIGWSPAIGYREGLQRTVQWYKRNGQL